MGADRTVRLSPADLALKLACEEAVRAAGGQEFVAREAGYAQSRVSDWCSPNTTAFMPLHVARQVEALGAGAPGHPHITRALARAQGAGVSDPAPAADPLHLCQWLARVGGESGDLLRALADGAAGPGIAAMPLELRRRIARELGEMTDLLGELGHALQREDSP